MIQCPNCKNTLPDFAQKCQFCQADVTKVPRAKGSAKPGDVAGQSGRYVSHKFVWGLYYTISVWWIVGGAIGVAEPFLTAKGQELSVFSYAGIAISAFSVLVGIGLLLQAELVRGIVNVLSFLKLVGGLGGLIGSLLGIVFAGPLGLLLVLYNIINIVVAGATIWVIGETRTRAM
ncbi:MAG: hypothetical protein JST30_04190 [Armatimonadetes bacterium]|nr:hypothetical protein [Armatimonadota bacterium]